LKLLYQRRKGLIFMDIPEPPREVVLFLCGYDAPVVLKSALAAHAFKARSIAPSFSAGVTQVTFGFLGSFFSGVRFCAGIQFNRFERSFLCFARCALSVEPDALLKFCMFPLHTAYFASFGNCSAFT